MATAAPKPAAAPAPKAAPQTTNGVAWNEAPPANVSFPVTNLGIGAGQFADAMQQAPQQVAAQNASIAENNANAQLAPLQIDEAKARIAAAQSQAQQAQLGNDDAMLQRIAPAIQNNPAFAQNPQIQALLGPIMQRRGLDAKDPNSLSALLTPPPKQFSEIKDADRAKILETPPGPARDALLAGYQGVPAEMHQAPQVMNEAAIIAFNNQFTRVMTEATSGKMTASQFEGFLNANRSNLVQAGLDPTALEKDPSIMAGVAPQLQLKLEQLKQLGGKYAIDAEKAQAAMLNAHSLADYRAIQEKYIGAQTAAVPMRTQVAMQNAATNAARASAYGSEVQQHIADSQNGSWAARQTVLGKDMAGVITMRRQAEVDVRMLTTAAQQATNAGTDPGDALMGQLQEAKQRLTQFQGLAKTMRDPATANAAVGNLASQVSGRAVKTDGKGAASFNAANISGRSKSNPAIVQMQDGSVWDSSANPPKMIRSAQ